MFNPCSGHGLTGICTPFLSAFRAELQTRGNEARSPVSIVSADVIACVTAVTGTPEIINVRILSVYNLARHSTHSDFYSVSAVFSSPGDYAEHVRSVRLTTRRHPGDNRTRRSFLLWPQGRPVWPWRIKNQVHSCLIEFPPELGCFCPGRCGCTTCRKDDSYAATAVMASEPLCWKGWRPGRGLTRW
jgi:hypothetical protein